MKIRKNDNVIMLGGKDKGKKAKVILVFPARPDSAGGPEGDKVVVEGLNLIKKHLRAKKQGQKGQIISKERAVSVSSVALVCKSCGKQTRVGYKVDGENKIRICKKCESEN
ncbi:MAG: 50S ribosomal protein L24 [Candidatus Taylorbacteria bacterium]|nr:50S ribosomal protein L24 [Candidatus Taylorbacteria bacterium]